MIVTFDQLLTLPVGTVVSVSDGTSMPKAVDVLINAWKSHNYTAIITTKTDTAVTLQLPMKEFTTPDGQTFQATSSATVTAENNYTYKTNSPSLAIAKAAKWEQVKELRTTVKDQGVMTPKGVVDSDQDSRVAIQAAAAAASSKKTEFEIGWVMKDNTVKMHSATDMEVCNEVVVEHVSNCHKAAAYIRTKIDECTTMSQLNSLDLETEWNVGFNS